MTDTELLEAVDQERCKFSRASEDLLREYVDELVARRVYPSHWPPPAPFERVQYWGAYWHLYSEPLHCPHCNADLRDRSWGPPGKREIGQYSTREDRTVAYQCPDCGKKWPRE